jgi:protoporphyrinogen oxidase
MPPRIIIIGAGPTGIGAALRLQELEYPEWHIYEKTAGPGGLSGSLTDAQGFTWDFGGHILFPTFSRINSLLQKLGVEFFHLHERRAFIRIQKHLVPYPFQNHIDYLPSTLRPEPTSGCHPSPPPENFFQWLTATFGHSLGELFFFPYNRKVWNFPLEEMSFHWVTKRISPPGEGAGQQWGPNYTFLYPRRGGMGGLFRQLATGFTSHLTYNCEITDIDLDSRQLHTACGHQDSFDFLISTIPLTELTGRILRKIPDRVRKAGAGLHWNSCVVTGTAFRQPTTDSFDWTYYPEPDYPFYRVTALSNYAESLVPEARTENCASFMTETTVTDSTTVPPEKQIITGLETADLTKPPVSRSPLTMTRLTLPFAYPIPTLKRDQNLAAIQPFLESQDILSRGRFGGWKYEVGNMDHSLMQGMEAIDRILLSRPERVYRS